MFAVLEEEQRRICCTELRMCGSSDWSAWCIWRVLEDVNDVEENGTGMNVGSAKDSREFKVRAQELACFQHQRFVQNDLGYVLKPCHQRGLQQ